jgi:NAD-dependent SIR2 family protein deacetylase
VIQVNPNATDLDAIADFNLRGTAATVMPALVRTVGAQDGPANARRGLE